MKPILFSTPMVRAILEGRKSQTRRIIKPQPRVHDHLDYIEAEWKNDLPVYVNSIDTPREFYCRLCGDGIGPDGHSIYKSKYQKGDILWVRETWIKSQDGFVYRADHYEDTLLVSPDSKTFDKTVKWKPSIFMPRQAARLFSEITDVRVERVQDISSQDAIAEGIRNDNGNIYHPVEYSITAYTELWNSINGKGSWESNPWVWVYEFKRVEL